MLNGTIIVGNLDGWWNGLVFGVRANFPDLDFVCRQSDSQSIFGHPFILPFSTCPWKTPPKLPYFNEKN